MSRAAALLVALAVFSVVLAYLSLGLQRLSTLRALFATAALAAVLLGTVVMLSPLAVTAPLMGLAALLAGHWGWWLGRRSRSPSRSGRAHRDRARRRPPPAAYRDSPARRAGNGAPPADIDRAQPLAAEPGAAPDSAVPAPPSAAVAPSAASRPTDRLPATPPSTATKSRATMPMPAAEQAAAASPTASVVSAQALPMADLQRTQLGRYRIDRAIGRGSMGAVFLGLDPVLGRQVAIKTMALGQEFAGAELDEAKRRFFREAETAGRLQHRDIVTIYDAGEDQDLAYIAMEFLKGHDLQRHTHAGQLLPASTVVRIGARVADALAYAHSQGVVHRDVKPANVMLHLPSGAVKVTDFGIARITDATRTRTGMVLGTPSFMAPEHLAGQRVDGRADLYGLGVMLFQLLTGQLPFQAESMAKLMYRIANEPPPDLRSLRPDLPAALAELLAQALSKAPAARPADGTHMAEALRAFDAAGEGLGAGPGAALSEPAAPPTKPYDATVRLVRDDSGHNSPS